jgi:hypothetical protein
MTITPHVEPSKQQLGAGGLDCHAPMEFAIGMARQLLGTAEMKVGVPDRRSATGNRFVRGYQRS